ncbi:MAG: hypothetical protein EHM72_18985 [Calditrichaeota bacterium]|nr:MAG: hypothetical protein EHM72_18985 [Calditrichota bacterium]
MTDSAQNGKVTYKDCMAFQQHVYDKIDQTEQRTLARIEALEKALIANMDQLKSKVYYNAGMIAVLSSIAIGVITWFLTKGR